MTDNWKAIAGLVAEIKRCEGSGATSAAVAMAYISIDTLASLGRPSGKDRVTRGDFISWVEEYLKADDRQVYQYRGKDVYAARCAVLHTYGSQSEMHSSDPDTRMFGYSDGGRHAYGPSIDPRLIIIGVPSFVNDVVHAIRAFIEKCKTDSDLRGRVEARLPQVLQTFPFPAADDHGSQ